MSPRKSTTTRAARRPAPALPSTGKSIVYDPETRDYRLSLDGELVGFARTYHEGDVTLDQLLLDRLNRGQAA